MKQVGFHLTLTELEINETEYDMFRCCMFVCLVSKYNKKTSDQKKRI